MGSEPDNYIINAPQPLDYGAWGIKSLYKKRAGKFKKTYTIEIRSEPIAVAGSALGVGAPLAVALLSAISARIKAAGSTIVSPGTEARRKAWGTTPKSPSAKFRFNAPTKGLSRAKRKANVHLPAEKQHKPEIKKGARPDDPPDPNAKGMFNHSGRLREGIAVIKGGARFSSSKKMAVWSIFAPANRLHEASFGNGFHDMLNEFNRLVDANQATQTMEYQIALREVSGSICKKLTQVIAEKRRYLRYSQARIVGRAFSAWL